MKQSLKPGNMELDLLTKEELEETITGLLSGYLRPPQRVREPSGVKLDGSGTGSFTAYTVEAGYQFVLTRIEFSLDGYSARTPYAPASGGIDLYVGDQWRDGFPFSSGLVLPATYTESESRAIVIYGGQHLTVKVNALAAVANVGFRVAVCGLLAPLGNIDVI